MGARPPVGSGSVSPTRARSKADRRALVGSGPSKLLDQLPGCRVRGVLGDQALRPTACHLRLWGTDPWTQGYVTQWPPGEVMAVGPLHGTHEPPFYVCGSDQWVAGYMEGAVRTGRAAAAAALHEETP